MLTWAWWLELPWQSHASVFAAGFVVDVVWAFYIRRVAAGAAVSAALLSGLVILLSVYNTASWLEHRQLVPAMVVGMVLGTYVVVRYEHRRHQATVHP